MKGRKRPRPHAMPYSSIDEFTAAQPEIFRLVFRGAGKKMLEYYDRQMVSKITGKSIPTLEMWAEKGWLEPVRKYGGLSLYSIEEIHELIETGEFPSQQDRT